MDFMIGNSASPPLNTPIAHNGSPECPVHPETTVRWGGITWNAWDVFWPGVTTYTIIARAPADRIAELEAALELAANRLQWCTVQFTPNSREFMNAFEWVEDARATLKRKTDV
jgi:hypothetical protein